MGRERWTAILAAGCKQPPTVLRNFADCPNSRSHIRFQSSRDLVQSHQKRSYLIFRKMSRTRCQYPHTWNEILIPKNGLAGLGGKMEHLFEDMLSRTLRRLLLGVCYAGYANVEQESI